MVERDPYGWSGLTPEHVKSLNDVDFELFCFELVQFEAFERHDEHDAHGPAGRFVGDGGRDILLTIRRTPTTAKQAYRHQHQLHPLTEDRVGRTVYSRKTGDWFKLAMRDIEQKRKTPSRAVEVLREGGYFKLFINQDGRLDGERKHGNTSRTPKEHLAHAFLKELKKLDPNVEDPADRIEIIDAHKLVRFLQARAPVGGNLIRWADQFRIRIHLDSLDEWGRFHAKDREDPPFVEDAIRSRESDEILRFLRDPITDPSLPVAWLIGPPGVGKTRLLIETLKRDRALAQRVRVAKNPDEAMDVLSKKEHLLAHHPDVVLIVDDCPLLDAGRVVINFRTMAENARARLIVVTPGGSELDKENAIERKWVLNPLGASSSKLLAANVLGINSQSGEVQDLVQLGQGYPWFITLLVREMMAEKRPPQDIREAVKIALASRSEVKEDDSLRLNELRLRRARCLLATSLTRRIDWDKLSESKKTNLVFAVGLKSWEELKETAVQCVQRGLLRRNLGWKYKYVTPLVVEREVIAWLFDPDGPGDGPRKINEFAKEYLVDFYETLGHLELPESLLAAIARHDFVALESVPLGPDALQQANMLGPRMEFIVRHAPEQAARELHRRVMNSSLEDLRAGKSERRSLVSCFDELAARRGLFALAEDALFKLGLAENEAYANNATHTWAVLFDPEMNVSYQSVEERIQLLLRRLNESEHNARLLALHGVKVVISAFGTRSVMVALDGERPETTPSAAHHARVRVWYALAQRFDDVAIEVAMEAKRIATLNLRNAGWTGVGIEVLEIIAKHAHTFDDVERIKLREVLLEIRTYDVSRGEDAPNALEQLEKRIAPISFREKFRQHVGTWRPARLRKDSKADEQIDNLLAREGLTDDAPIFNELDWLFSNDAVRSTVFARALGRQDEHASLFEALRARARSTGDTRMPKVILARYVAGMGEAGRTLMVETMLRQLDRVQDEAEVVALATLEVGATDERLAWIEQALKEEKLGAWCIEELGRRNWLSNLDNQRFEQFVGTLLDHSSVPRALAAVEQLVHAAKERPNATESIKTLLLQALSYLTGVRLEIMPGHYWELAAKFLIRHGEAKRVAEYAVRLIAHAEGPKEYAWNALHAVAAHDPSAAWEAIASVLAENTPEAGHLILAFMFHRSSFVWPREDVLAWVGQDERRGRTVVSLVPRGVEELDPILRALVQRFGPRSSVANEIIARMHSTNGLVPSLAEHDARHLARTRTWLEDSDSSVREFAKRLVDSFADSHAYHAAIEEDERRRWGT